MAACVPPMFVSSGAKEKPKVLCAAKWMKPRGVRHDRLRIHAEGRTVPPFAAQSACPSGPKAAMVSPPLRWHTCTTDDLIRPMHGAARTAHQVDVAAAIHRDGCALGTLHIPLDGAAEPGRFPRPRRKCPLLSSFARKVE